MVGSLVAQALPDPLHDQWVESAGESGPPSRESVVADEVLVESPGVEHAGNKADRTIAVVGYEYDR